MATLTIGTRLEDPDKTAQLIAGKFNRHTFWCGQSGSGKTYALGVVLEQLLLQTELPLVILDPNADYIRLQEFRQGADADSTRIIADSDIRVFHTTKPDGERLHTRFLDLSTPAKAAVLELDPIAHAEEYNALLRADLQAARFDDARLLEAMRASGDPGKVRLAMRIENLQVLEWGLWSRGGGSVTDVIDERPRATVLDLGGFTHLPEPRVAALSVLERLWATRESRRPVLIVIDEAHNICPPDPDSLVARTLVERVVQIAAEGRKFGLWLFLSTQQPTKIHPNVLSQCDNLGLMRMNAPRDLAEIAEVFGFVPKRLLDQAASFRQGQALFAGGFVEEPLLVQMGARLTEEGGTDVRVPLRAE